MIPSPQPTFLFLNKTNHETCYEKNPDSACILKSACKVLTLQILSKNTKYHFIIVTVIHSVKSVPV